MYNSRENNVEPTKLHALIKANDIKLLLMVPSRMSDMGVQNADGLTPTLYAATLGRWSLVRELVSNISHKENDPYQYGKTLMLAMEKGKTDIALLLVKVGKYIVWEEKSECLKLAIIEKNEPLIVALALHPLEEAIERIDWRKINNHIQELREVKHLLPSTMVTAVTRMAIKALELAREQKNSADTDLSCFLSMLMMNLASFDDQVISKAVFYTELFRLAAEANNTELMCSILNNQLLLISKEDKQIALKIAIKRNNKQIIDKLGLPSLKEAIELQDRDLITYCVSDLCARKNADFELIEGLDLIIKEELKNTEAELTDCLMACIEKLLNAGAKLTVFKSKSVHYSPLQSALQQNQSALAALLIKYIEPWQLHFNTQTGDSALTMAVDLHQWAIVEMMLIKSQNLVSPTSSVAKECNLSIEKAFLHIIKIKENDVFQKEGPLFLRCLYLFKELPLTVSAVNEKGHNALQIMANAQDWEMVGYILEKAAFISRPVLNEVLQKLIMARYQIVLSQEIVEEDDEIRLTIEDKIKAEAKSKKETEQAHILLNYIEICLEAGAEAGYISIPSLKNTLLHLAIANRDEPLMRLLLQYAPFEILHLSNNVDNTPFSLAVDIANWTVLRSMLINAGNFKSNSQYDDTYKTIFLKIIQVRLENSQSDPLLWDCVFLVSRLIKSFQISKAEGEAILEKANQKGDLGVIMLVTEILSAQEEKKVLPPEEPAPQIPSVAQAGFFKQEPPESWMDFTVIRSQPAYTKAVKKTAQEIIFDSTYSCICSYLQTNPDASGARRGKALQHLFSPNSMLSDGCKMLVLDAMLSKQTDGFLPSLNKGTRLTARLRAIHAMDRNYIAQQARRFHANDSSLRDEQSQILDILSEGIFRIVFTNF